MMKIQRLRFYIPTIWCKTVESRNQVLAKIKESTGYVSWYLYMYSILLCVHAFGILSHFWYFYKSLNFYLCIAEFYMSLVFTTCILVHLFSNWTCSLTSTYIWYFICILYIDVYLETQHDCILTWSSWYKYFCLSLMWAFTSQYWHKHLLVPVHVYMYIC